MDFVVIPVVAFLASALTLFSGFGLGTLLLPAFLAFFPAEIAVGLTAVVHILNNIFKFVLVRQEVERAVVLRFGLPAIGAAVAGAWLLGALAGAQTEISYELFSRRWVTSPVKLTMGVLIASFAVLEVAPWFQRMAVGKKYLPLGGVLSGFFGGLSGHQGAFRSMFLLRSGLSRDAFIATNIAIALLVDAARLPVYAAHLSADVLSERAVLLGVVIAAAFAGAYAARRMAQRTAMRSVQTIVAVLLFVVAAGLIAGML